MRNDRVKKHGVRGVILGLPPAPRAAHASQGQACRQRSRGVRHLGRSPPQRGNARQCHLAAMSSAQLAGRPPRASLAATPRSLPPAAAARVPAARVASPRPPRPPPRAAAGGGNCVITNGCDFDRCTASLSPEDSTSEYEVSVAGFCAWKHKTTTTADRLKNECRCLISCCDD